MATLVQTYVEESVAQFPKQPTSSQIAMGFIKAKVEQSALLDDKNGDLVLAWVLMQVLPFIPSKVTEGGYSVEWNQAAISAFINTLFANAGIVSPLIAAPTVSDKSYLW